MTPWRFTLAASRLFLALALSGCGGGEELLVPTQASPGAQVQGLLREHATGELTERDVEHLLAVFDAETLRAPEWSVSGGDLWPNGHSVRWRLPEAGRHTITLTLYLVDGRQAQASWAVDVKARGSPER